MNTSRKAKSLKWLLTLAVVALLSFAFFGSKTYVFESYPSALHHLSSSTSEEAKLPEEPVEPLMFLGDVMLGRHVETLINQNGTRYLTEHFEKWLASSSAVFINFESAIAVPHQRTPSGGMTFSTDPAHLSVLRQLSVTHASLANNHSTNYGQSGYAAAAWHLQANDIAPFGHPTSLSSSSVTYTKQGDETVAVVAIHTLFTHPNALDLETLMTEAKANSSFQIAYIHWGDEYALTHNVAQAKLAEELVGHGIDLIIGHHPHVTQDIDIVSGVPVFYSLGNFIFDQYFDLAVKQGLALGVTLSKDSFVVSLIPHQQCHLSVPCPMSALTETDYIQALAQRSESSIREQIVAKNITFLRK